MRGGERNEETERGRGRVRKGVCFFPPFSRLKRGHYAFFSFLSQGDAFLALENTERGERKLETSRRRQSLPPFYSIAFTSSPILPPAHHYPPTSIFTTSTPIPPTTTLTFPSSSSSTSCVPQSATSRQVESTSSRESGEELSSSVGGVEEGDQVRE